LYIDVQMPELANGFRFIIPKTNSEVRVPQEARVPLDRVVNFPVGAAFHTESPSVYIKITDKPRACATYVPPSLANPKLDARYTAD
jgi:hypothetical protein